MSALTRIDRYIFKELIPPFTINLGFFTFIFMMTSILEITNLIVNYRVDLSSVIWMLIYSMPFFLVFILPMSVMMSVLLTFLRMSGENEITALKSAGVSPYRLLPPVLCFCLAGTATTFFMANYGQPWGKRAFNRLALTVAESSVNAGLKARTFIDSFEGVVLYVNKIDTKTKELIDVFVQEQKVGGAATTIVAPRGALFSEHGTYRFHLRLYNGSINQADVKHHTANAIQFDTYEINLDVKEAVTAAITSRKEIEEMGLGELRAFIQTSSASDPRYYTAKMRFHEKISIPFACFALGVLAVPLGLQSRTDRRSLGIVTGIILFLLYYIMLSVGYAVGESGAYPPVLGMWTPNLVMGGIGAYLLVRAAADRPLRFDILYYVRWFIRRFVTYGKTE